MRTVYTIGHSTRPLDEFLSLTHHYNIQRVIDIRTVPRSRTNPQFNRETLPEDLQKAGIGYLHCPGLGGLRHPIKDSPNNGWRNSSFRGFADYMQTEEFSRNLEELIRIATSETICLMCAEAVPWRCHRSLIADALTVRGATVMHILSATNHYLHKMTPWAKISELEITYPGEGITSKAI